MHGGSEYRPSVSILAFVHKGGPSISAAIRVELDRKMVLWDTGKVGDTYISMFYIVGHTARKT